MNAPIPILALLALGAPGAAPAPAPAAPVPATIAPAAEEWAELIDAYELAEDEYRAELRAAEPKDRRAIREHHPATEFWPRFEAASEAGEGRADLWMIRHLRDKGLRLSEQRAAKPPIYARLFGKYVTAGWFGEVLDELRTERRVFEEAQVVDYYKVAIEKSPADEVRAQAMYQLGKLYLDSDDPKQQAAGKAWLKRVDEELGDTSYATWARTELYKPVVGQPAPDFTGRTIDGATFKLSDYRGKVVLLDFYGFW